MLVCDLLRDSCVILKIILALVTSKTNNTSLEGGKSRFFPVTGTTMCGTGQ